MNSAFSSTAGGASGYCADFQPSASAASAAVYRRVSTDHQDGSLETQETRVNSYLEVRGFTATEQTTFFDEDTSGSIAICERPGGSKLFATLALSLSKGEPIKHLVVAKLDRLGRSARDLLTTVDTLTKMGVTLHIVDMGGDSLSSQGPAGKLMFTVLAGMAEFERELIRGRIQDALDRRFEQSRLIGTVPYGYSLSHESPTSHSSHELVPAPAEQLIIRRIARQRAADCSYKQIADQLNADGVPTKTSKGKWQCGNVSGVLNSRHSARLLAEEPAEVAA